MIYACGRVIQNSMSGWKNGLPPLGYLVLRAQTVKETKLYLQIFVQKSVICEYSFSLNLCLTHLQYIVISLKTLVTHLLKYICLPPCCTFLGQKYSARSRVPLYCPDNLIFCKCSVLKISNICNVLI